LNFELTEEQKNIKAQIRDFCKQEVDLKHLREIADIAASAKDVEELRAVFPFALSEKLQEAGLRQLAVPKEYGGRGVDWITQALAAEEAGYSGGPLCRFLTIPWHFCEYTATYATKEQQDKFFSRFMKDKRLCLAASITEPGAGTNIFHPYDEPGAAMEGFAYKDGDSWVINAEKMFCAGGGVAQMIFLFVRTDKKGPISESMSCFWVSTDLPGIEMELNDMIAADMGGNVKFKFTDVRVPENSLVSEVNKACKPLVNSAAVEKLIHFYGLLGISQRLYEHMKDYAKQRIQGGKPIIEHINIGSILAEAAVNLEAFRALMYRAAWEYNKKEDGAEPVYLNPVWGHFCNYYYKKMALRLCEIGAEVYGGVGTLTRMPLESYIRYLFSMFPGGSTPTMNLISCVPYLDSLETDL